MLWFELGGISLTASAHHFLTIRDIDGLPTGTPIIELGDVLDITHPPSKQAGGVAHPGGDGLIWLGLGERATLWTCDSHNILVFPPWLSTDLSGKLLPACFIHAMPHHGALTWILDIAQIARSPLATTL